MIQGSDGNFYGTTFEGGVGYGAVYRITPQGQVRVLYSFTAGNDGFNPYGGVIQASDGSFYGTTGYGGGTGCNSGSGCGIVFKISLK